ncbi:MAG: hypothetical protein H3C48_13845 [Chitinophagaceae bacterium]|nr:hypothetical protein [Chitinophagaceae bacterium]
MIRVNIILSVLLFYVLWLWSCNMPGKIYNQQGKQHWIAVTRPSVGAMYIDSIPLQSVMKVTEDKKPYQKFKAYLIGFSDSVVLRDKSDQISRNRYYQYDLQHDWAAITGGQELKPVFYQPRTSLTDGLHEGIIVFELNGNNHPDTLIYTDSFGSWGKQKFILEGE